MLKRTLGLAALCLLVAGCLPTDATEMALLSPSETPPEEDARAGVDTSSWQLYENQEIGFRILYPPDWEYRVYQGAVGFRPVTMGEDYLWGLMFHAASEASVEEIVAAIGAQFGSQRSESIEAIAFNGIPAQRVVVTTASVPDWYSVSIIFERGGLIYRISNGAVMDDRFEPFYESFMFLP